MRSIITTSKLQIGKLKSSKNYLFLLTISFCLLSLLSQNTAHAQGVAAGTDISNIVTVNYTVGNTVQTPVESSPTGNSVGGVGNGQATVFKVDRKIDLLLTGDSDANVNPGDLQSEVTFTLTNEGNDNQEFSLLPDYTLTSDNFDSSNCNVEITGVTGTPLAGVTLPTSGDIKLKADQQASVSVKCDIPYDNGGLPILTGHTSLVSLIATTERNDDGSSTVETTSADTAMGVETVFTDDANVDDALRDAMHSARRTYTAASSTVLPTLTMDKTIVSVIDSSGGNTAVTGSKVTYNIHISTTGIGVINNLIITDPTPAEMTYDTESMKLDTVSVSDSNDADAADFGITTADTATINLGNITAGSQYDIQLTYIIN